MRLSRGMKAALLAFSGDPSEWMPRDQLILNGASTSALSSLKSAGLVEKETDREHRRRRWFRLTTAGAAALERIGG